MMNILFLVQSHIPEARYDEYMPILRETLSAVRSQRTKQGWEVDVVLSDDGSDHLKHLSSKDISLLPKAKLEAIRADFSLDVDDAVLMGPSDKFYKAELFNHYLKRKGGAYDLIVFLDDDHPFLSDGALARFVKHRDNGYNFIAGRIYKGDRFRTYWTNCQGTSYAITYDLLSSIGFFNMEVSDWGLGDDEDLLWRLYLESKKGNVRALFDGNIITTDRVAGRWRPCQDKAGGLTHFTSEFEKKYSVHPYENNPSLNYSNWMDLEPDEKGIPQRYYDLIDLEDYNRINSFTRADKTGAYLRWMGHFMCRFPMRVIKFLRRKMRARYPRSAPETQNYS